MPNLKSASARENWVISYLPVWSIFIHFLLYSFPAVGQPDLVCSISFLEKTELEAGETFNATSITTNQGVLPAFNNTEGFLTNYYLSENETYEVNNDFFIGGEFFGTEEVLLVGGSLIEDEELDLNKDGINVPDGEYFLLCVTDPPQEDTPIGNILELNENNNVFVFGTKITVGNAGALPDLVCSITFLEKTDLVPGETFNASSRTFNQGLGDAFNTEDGFLTNYFLSDNNTYERDNDFFIGGEFFDEDEVLKSGEFFDEDEELDLNKDGINVPNGEYFLLCVTDPFNADFPIGKVEESDENNNVFVFGTKITVGDPPLPDLVCTIDFVEKTTLQLGETFDATSSTTNQGDADAFNTEDGFLTNYYLSTDNSFEKDNDFFIGGEFFGTDKILKPGETFVEDETLDLNKDGINVPAGEYFLLGVTDPFGNEAPTGNIEEKNENNNVFIFGTKITVEAPLPDLIITNPALTDTDVLPEETTTASLLLKNEGEGDAAASKICFYLSTDNLLGGTDILIGEVAAPNLASNGEIELSQELTIPAGTIPGNYFILFEADCDKIIIESDETNNLESVGINVNQPFPDLVINDESVNPTNLLPNEVLTATFNLLNEGNGAAGISTVCFYLSTDNTLGAADVLLGEVESPAIATGGQVALNKDLTIPIGTIAGNYFILFEADCDEDVVESDENNNIVAVPISVGQLLADLTISTPSLTVTELLPEETTTASLILKNEGDGDAAASSVCFYLSQDNLLGAADILLSEIDAAALVAGGELTISQDLIIPVGTAPGNYFILFEADCKKAIVESNENNNVNSVGITVAQPLPDLTIEDEGVDPEIALPGESIFVSFIAKNIGVGSSAASSVCIFLSQNDVLEETDELLKQVAVQAILAGNQISFLEEIIIPEATLPGNYTLLIEIDCNEENLESNENNNVISVAFTVDQPLADLSISNPVLTPNGVFPGESLSANFSLDNLDIGDAPASTICFHFSQDNILDGGDLSLEEANAQALLALSSAALTQELTIPAGIEPGTYFIIFEADCGNAINESNEANNVVAVAVSVGQPQADLIVENPVIDPSVLAQGEVTQVTFTLSNIGTGDADISKVCFHLSENQELDIADLLIQEINVDDLASGESGEIFEEITIPASIVAGNYFLILEADCGEEIPESDESNNTIAVPITVNEQPRPDLLIQDASIDPVVVLTGDSLQANFTVTNQGNGAADTSKACLFLSLNNTFESAIDIEVGRLDVSALPVNTSELLTTAVNIPANTNPGTYFILFIADCNESLDEVDEANNIATVEISIGEPLADLSLGSIEVSPDKITAGQQGSVSAEVVNQDQANAPLSSTCFFLSTNDVFETGIDVLLATAETAVIVPNGSQLIQETLIIPANTEPGNYFIIGVADCQNEITESNENNNTLSTTITIEEAPDNNPDLAVFDPAISSSIIRVGENNTATFNIQNLSASFGADASLACLFLSEDDTFNPNIDISLADVATPPLDTLESIPLNISFSISNSIQAGNYQLFFVADCNDDITEDNESNNIRSIPVVVEDSIGEGNPDLTIGSPSGLPSNPQPQQQVNVSVDIRNEGDGASEAFEICVVYSEDGVRDNFDREIIAVTVNSIGPNSDTTISLSFTLPGDLDSGDFLIFVADCDNVNQDPDLSNNVFPALLEIIPSNRCDGLNFTNVVTPNGDGVNDEWVITGLPEDHSLRIVDRWGNEILSTGNYQQNWPGSTGAFTNTPPGSYFYILVSELLLDAKPCKGSILVIR